MDLEQLQTFKTQLGDNTELISAFSKIESDIKVLSENKQAAVGKEKEFRAFKQDVSKLFGLQDGLNIEDSLKQVGELHSGFQSKINALTDSTSGKNLEVADLKELITNTQAQLKVHTDELASEKDKNKLSGLKTDFRTALNAHGIKGQDQQDLVINGHMSTISTIDNFSELAKSIATQKPYLVDTSLNGGAGSTVLHKENNVGALSNIKLNDKQSRIAAIQGSIAQI